jgi:hypothetical protein
MGCLAWYRFTISKSEFGELRFRVFMVQDVSTVADRTK